MEIIIIESGISLELDAGVTIDIEGMSPFFDKELKNGEVSMPVDIPVSSVNSRALGSPEDLSLRAGELSYAVDINHRGVRLSNFRLKIIEILDVDLRGNSGYYSCVITGQLGILANKLGAVRLRDLLKTVVDYSDEPSTRDFATKVMKGSYPEYLNQFAFAPVFAPDYFESGRMDYDEEKIQGEMLNRVIYNNNNNSWTFGSIKTGGAPNQPTIAGEEEYIEYRSVPFLNLLFVIRKIEDYFGIQIIGDIHDIPDIHKVHIWNNVSIEQYRFGAKLDIAKGFLLADHVPDMSVYEFLYATMHFWGLVIDARKGDVLVTRFADPGIQLDASVYLDDLVENKVDISFFDELEEGYRFGFKEPEGDSRFSEAKKELPEVVTDVPTYEALANVGNLSEGDVFYIEDENVYVEFVFGNFSYYGEGLHDVEVGNGGVEYRTKASPMAQAIYNDGNNISYKVGAVGYGGKGTYYNHSRVRIVNEFDYRLFYIDNVKVGDIEGVPAASSTGIAHGQRIASINMSTRGDNSLYTLRHERFLNLLRSSKIVKVEMRSELYMDADTIFNTEYVLNRERYLAVRYSLSIGSSDRMELWLAGMG